MKVSPKKDCPYVEKTTLIDKEKFQKIPFDALKCQKCDESNDLWICLVCGEIFCSRSIKGHFVEHNKANPEHCLCLGIGDFSVWCSECINDKQNDSNDPNVEKHPVEKGCFIESNKTTECITIILIYFLTEKK